MKCDDLFQQLDRESIEQYVGHLHSERSRNQLQIIHETTENIRVSIGLRHIVTSDYLRLINALTYLLTYLLAYNMI